MSEEENYFNLVGDNLELCNKGNLFGKPCYKFNKKAFICFFEKSMVFKLNGKFHAAAIDLNGAKLFDPSNKNRPMKEWVQVPFEFKERWNDFALKALNYAMDINY